MKNQARRIWWVLPPALLLLAVAFFAGSWYLVLSAGLLILGAIGYLEDILKVQIPKRTIVLLLIAFVALSVAQSIFSIRREKSAEQVIHGTQESLAEAKKEINDLEFTVEALRDYAPWAKLNGEGKTGRAGVGLLESSDLISMLQGCLYEREGETIVSTTSEARRKYLRTIEKYPDFPFPYYYLSLYYHELGDTLWESYAEKALFILQRTTAIAGHHQAHDVALEKLLSLRRGSQPYPSASFRP
ncbi:MAG: hypothetical protein ABIJ61_07715 [bacterium]